MTEIIKKNIMTILEILKKDLINSYLKIENDYKRITNVTTINDQIVLCFTDDTTTKIGLNDDLDLCGETGYKIRQLINKYPKTNLEPISEQEIID